MIEARKLRILKRRTAMRAQQDRGANQRAGFMNMHQLQLGQGQRLAHTRQIDGLTSRHTARTAGLRQQPHHGELLLGPGQDLLGKQLKSQRLQSVSHQQCGGFIILHMTGWLATPQHIVVHARHVVMHQRIHMDHFDSGSHPVQRRRIATDQLARSVSQQRADALATTQRHITHRGVHALRRRG
jgi:hypothetical protein